MTGINLVSPMPRVHLAGIDWRIANLFVYPAPRPTFHGGNSLRTLRLPRLYERK